jgi:hypothetical protein
MCVTDTNQESERASLYMCVTDTSQESERASLYMCVTDIIFASFYDFVWIVELFPQRGILFWNCSHSVVFYFGTVPTAWYFFVSFYYV